MIHREENQLLPKPIHIDRPVLVFLLAVMVCLNAAVLLNNWKAVVAGSINFPIFYFNAQMVREGKVLDLYDSGVKGSNHRIGGSLRPPNNHLPYELLLFVPFTYVRFQAASILWAFLSLAMLVAVAMAIREFCGSGWSFSLTLLTVLAFYPVWYCVIAGQDSILLLLLFAASFWLWKREKEAMAGFVLALGLFRPQLVLPFFLVAFLAGRWKFVRGFVPGAVLVMGLSTWVVGLHGMGNYVRILLAQGTETSASELADRWLVRPGLMPTWRGFLCLLLPTWMPTWARTLLLLFGTALGLGWAAKKMRTARDSAAFDMAVAITLATVLLVSFHSYLQDFSLMILPLMIWRSVLVTQIVPRNSAYLMGGFCFLLFLTPLYLVLYSLGSLGWLFPIQAEVLWVASRSELIAGEALVARQPREATAVEIT